MDEEKRLAYEAGWAEMTKRCSQATDNQIAQMAKELESRWEAASEQGVEEPTLAHLEGERVAVKAFSLISI